MHLLPQQVLGKVRIWSALGVPGPALLIPDSLGKPGGFSWEAQGPSRPWQTQSETGLRKERDPRPQGGTGLYPSSSPGVPRRNIFCKSKELNT